MDMTQRLALAQRLEAVELALQAAVAGAGRQSRHPDAPGAGPDAYCEAEAQALEVISARALEREARSRRAAPTGSGPHLTSAA